MLRSPWPRMVKIFLPPSAGSDGAYIFEMDAVEAVLEHFQGLDRILVAAEIVPRVDAGADLRVMVLHRVGHVANLAVAGMGPVVVDGDGHVVFGHELVEQVEGLFVLPRIGTEGDEAHRLGKVELFAGLGFVGVEIEDAVSHEADSRFVQKGLGVMDVLRRRREGNVVRDRFPVFEAELFRVLERRRKVVAAERIALHAHLQSGIGIGRSGHRGSQSGGHRGSPDRGPHGRHLQHVAAGQAGALVQIEFGHGRFLMRGEWAGLVRTLQNNRQGRHRATCGRSVGRRFGGSAPVGIDPDAGQQQGAEKHEAEVVEFERESILNPEDGAAGAEAFGQNGDEKHADDRAQDRTVSANDRRSAKYDGDDDLQFQTVVRGGTRRTVVGGEADSGEKGQNAAQRIDLDQPAIDANGGVAGGHAVAADHQNLFPPARPAEPAAIPPQG